LIFVGLRGRKKRSDDSDVEALKIEPQVGENNQNKSLAQDSYIYEDQAQDLYYGVEPQPTYQQTKKV